MRYLWQSRQWRLLANLIDGLPYGSHLRQAQLNDEDYVVELLELEEEAKKAAGEQVGPDGVPVSEWSREVETLTSIGQDIRNLTTVVRSAFGDKKAPPAYAGPSTIVKRASVARQRKQHERLARRLVPHRFREE